MKEITLTRLVSFLDSELRLQEFPKDESINGLQVEGREKIRKVGIAVDACGYVFERAAELKVDFLFVHHGLIWGGSWPHFRDCPHVELPADGDVEHGRA